MKTPLQVGRDVFESLETLAASASTEQERALVDASKGAAGLMVAALLHSRLHGSSPRSGLEQLLPVVVGALYGERAHAAEVEKQIERFITKIDALAGA